jgi:octaprenyl-diphosphate synthase
LLSQALLLVTKNKAYDLLEIMALPIRSMSEGELLQIEKSQMKDISENIYFEIINKKTASLIAACTATGAKSVGASNNTIEQMLQIGEMLGMAFQIRDDIFDYQEDNYTGKPAGNDIIEKKITLPLIYALNQVDIRLQKNIIDLIDNAAANNENIELVRNFVIEYKGLEYASEISHVYRDKAIKLISKLEGNHEIRDSLISLSYYITNRNK